MGMLRSAVMANIGEPWATNDPDAGVLTAMSGPERSLEQAKPGAADRHGPSFPPLSPPGLAGLTPSLGGADQAPEKQGNTDRGGGLIQLAIEAGEGGIQPVYPLEVGGAGDCGWG